MKIVYLAFSSFLLFLYCEKDITSISTEEVLYHHKILKVGCYTELKPQIDPLRFDTDCMWEEDPGNPESFFVYGHFFSKVIGFKTAGIYKFRVKLGVIENSTRKVKVENFFIKVYPRDNIIFQDPSLELKVRVALKLPTEDLTENILSQLENLLIGSGDLGGDIYSIEGIQKCKDLKSLVIHYTSITDLEPI